VKISVKSHIIKEDIIRCNICKLFDIMCIIICFLFTSFCLLLSYWDLWHKGGSCQKGEKLTLL